MSFSRGFKDRNSNPCQAWIEFGKVALGGDTEKTDHPVFYRWDKALKQNVEVDLTQGFLVLDPFVMKVSGYNKKMKKNVISNEVRNVNDKMTVISYLPDGSKHVWFEGTYKELKDSDRMQGIGAKYCQSLYIAIAPECAQVESDEVLIIANIGASGGCFEAWRNFSDHVRASDFSKKVIIQKPNVLHPKVNGEVHYEIPEFCFGNEITADQAAKAHDLDIVLQECLDAYFKKGGSIDTSTSQEVDYEEESQELPPPPEETNEPKCMLFKLKDGRTLSEVRLEDLEGMLTFMQSKNTPQIDPRYINIAAAIKYRKSQKALDISDDDDDIPF